MALPKIDLPTYDFEVPSTGKTIKYRPFSVKEQKLLLIANESNDEKTIYETIKQVVTNCILTDGFDFDSFTTFDLEFFFIKLRINSISEKMSLNFVCNNQVDDKPCGHKLQFDYDLNNVKVNKPNKEDKKVFFKKDVGVLMKYPGLETLKVVADKQQGNAGKLSFDLLISCIDYIFDGQTVYKAKETDPAELQDFIESLPAQNLEKMMNFIMSIPTVRGLVEHDCPKCGFHHSVTVEGLTNFFG